MAEAVITRRGKKSYVGKVLADVVVTTATTQVDITGLNIARNKELMLSMTLIGNSSYVDVQLLINANYTVTNYYSQELYANGTGVSGERSNTAKLFYVATAGNSSHGVAYIQLGNTGYLQGLGMGIRQMGTAPTINYKAVKSNFTSTTITSIRISGTEASSLGVGTRIRLYEV